MTCGIMSSCMSSVNENVDDRCLRMSLILQVLKIHFIPCNMLTSANLPANFGVLQVENYAEMTVFESVGQEVKKTIVSEPFRFISFYVMNNECNT